MSDPTTAERLARRRRLVRREQDYAWEDRPYAQRTLAGILDRIDEASDLVAEIGPKVDPTEHEEWHEQWHFGDTVGAEKLDAIVRLQEVLDEIDRAIPNVEGWVVLKVYRERADGTRFSTPKVWIATTTREQAEALAPAIERHYASQGSRVYNEKSGRHDRFVVAWGVARADDFVRPGLTAAEYVRGLG